MFECSWECARVQRRFCVFCVAARVCVHACVCTWFCLQVATCASPQHLPLLSCTRAGPINQTHLRDWMDAEGRMKGEGTGTVTAKREREDEMGE